MPPMDGGKLERHWAFLEEAIKLASTVPGPMSAADSPRSGRGSQVRIAPDHLRRLAEGAQERAAHALAIGEAGFARNHLDRVLALLHHQARGFDA